MAREMNRYKSKMLEGDMGNLTQARLKELLHYDPSTGIFTWIKRASNRVHVGAAAGSINSHGYIQIRVDGTIHGAHRLAFLYMIGTLPAEQADHISHIRNDNRWDNLRQASPLDNKRNNTLQSNNTSGHTGVYWNKENEKWTASITVEGKCHYIGCFQNKGEAIAEREAANVKYGFHENHGRS